MEREKREIQEKSKSCTGATKTECKRAIEPDISDEVPALAYIKKEREVYIMDKIKVSVKFILQLSTYYAIIK